MTAFSREKIALVVFVLLVLVGIGSLVAYLNIGHNWNVTAAQIDDATGELEGYTAILYAGTAEKEQPAVGAGKGSSSESAGGSATNAADDSEDAGASAAGSADKFEDAGASVANTSRNSDGTSSAGSEGSSGQDEAFESGSSETSDREEGSLSGANDERSDDSSGSCDASQAPVGESRAGDTAGSSSEAENETAGADEAVGSSASSGGGASSSMLGGSAPLFASSRSAAKENDFVTVEDAAASYRDKQATVFVLDVENPAQYVEGMILKKGDRRIGVFSVSFNEPLPSVQAKVDYLRECAVDFVVAITPDRSFVERATGIDIAISLKNEGASFMGGSVDGTFYADAPLTGQVGSILVSPYNVVSARDIEEL